MYVLTLRLWDIMNFLNLNYFHKRCSKRPPCIWRQACTRLVIHLVTLSIVPGVSRICQKPCSTLFRSISACSIDVACTIDFKCLHKWKSSGFKSGERAGHAIGSPRPIHLFAKCWFKNCLATRLKRGGAPSCINRIPSLISTGTSSNISRAQKINVLCAC